jgi:hypothetical protein
MRWLAVLVLVVGCGSPHRGADRRTLPVEDVALWFMRAALAGDRATASTLAVTDDEATLQALLDQLAREGDESDGEVVAARVIQRRTLDPKVDETVTRPIAAALVQYRVRDRDGSEHRSPLPWLFVKTPDGWRLSPQK